MVNKFDNLKNDSQDKKRSFEIYFIHYAYFFDCTAIYILYFTQK